jgi:hypothetical protein
MEEEEKCIEMFGGKAWRKREFGKHSRRWKDCAENGMGGRGLLYFGPG